MVNYYTSFLAALSTPGRQISGYPPASSSRIILTWILLYCLFFVVSFLLPLFCRLFFVASLGALFNVSYWLPSLLLCGELDHWLGHGRSGVQGCRCCCWLLRVVLVEDADHLPEVHDGRKRFPGILFFQVTLPCN